MRQTLLVPCRGRAPGRRLPSSLARLVLFSLFALSLAACGRRSGSEIKIGVLVLQGRGTLPASPAAPGANTSDAPAAASPTGNGAAAPAAGTPGANVANSFGMRGLTLALEQLNAGKGGSRPVRLITVPADGDAAHTAAAFRRLVEKEKVAAVIASVTSAEALACAPIANQTHTILLTTAATSADIRLAGDYVFRNVASTSAGAEILAQAVARRFPRSAKVIVYPDLEFGASYRDGLQAAFTAHGEEPAETFFYPSRATDLTPTVERLAQTSAPVILLVGSEGDLARLVKQARERGIKAQFLLGGDLSEGILAAAGPAAEGAIAAVDGFDPEASDPRTRAFVDTFRTRFGTTPSYFNVATFDALGLIASLQRQGATTGPALRDALYAASGYIGASGRELTFDADGESGIPPRLVEVRAGKFQPVK